jgi:hypothetical protein
MLDHPGRRTTMLTIDPLAGSAPQEPHDLLATAVADETTTGPGASRGCLDTSIERPGHTRLVASWSADARPAATCSVHARPTRTLQRRLIAGLIG